MQPTRTARPAPGAYPIASVRFGGFANLDWHVEVRWLGVHVDRPTTFGWAVLTQGTAKRLAAAVNAGAVFGPAEIRIDDGGQSYVHAESKIWARELERELRELGF